MKTLYPEITPFDTFFLDTGSRHRVYVERCGNPEGLPVVFLHGGPCSGCRPEHRRFFDPEKYHIVLFDQRGCGRSEPFGEFEGNTTQDLIDDMERIRRRLGIERWLVFGGSWGGALALLYGQQHVGRVAGFVIRAVFLAREKDLQWFVQEDGVARIYPEQWRRLQGSGPGKMRGDLLAGLCAVFQGDDEVARRRVAREWSAWGSQVSLASKYRPGPCDEHASAALVRQVAMEMHYAENRYFIGANQILDGCPVLQTVPTIIIHGRNDLVCPMEAGYSLHRALPGARFIVLDDAGHVARGAAMINALVNAADDMTALISDASV